MPINVFWDKTILRIDVNGVWDWVEYDRATNDLHVLLHNKEQPTDVIFYPLDGLSASHEYVFVAALLAENVRELVIVGSDTSFEATASVFVESAVGFTDRTTNVNALQDAYTFLSEKYG